MREAAVLSCPTCGGPVAALDRTCGYCGSPVATVRCARCFAMNPPEAAHCAGCGLGLGLQPIGEAGDLSCPDCNVGLTTFSSAPGALRDCGRCGGQFVDHALLRDLIERREVYGEAAPRPFPKANPLRQEVRYRRCPVCRALMNRRNFGKVSGIVVDQCGLHGTWFDAGELPRVLEFVETGGLARARRIEVEEQDRLRRERAAALPVSSPMVLEAERDASLAEDLAAALSVLLESIVSFLKRH